MTLIIFTEEPSMKEALDNIIPKIGVAPESFKIIASQGISDLKRSVPMKMKAWLKEEDKFLIICDKDNADCAERKREIMDIVKSCGKEEKSKVRIACHELEAWFLGDVEALDLANLGPKTSRKGGSSRWPDPDAIEKPSKVLEKQFGHYAKVAGAKKISKNIVLKRNRSRSFMNTVNAICELTRIDHIFA